MASRNHYSDAYRERALSALRLTRERQREVAGRIARLYESCAEDLASQAARTGSLTERWLTAYTRSLRERTAQLWTQVGQTAENGLAAAARAGASAQTGLLYGLAGPGLQQTFTRMFASAPDRAVRQVLSGELYGGKAPMLSKRIWNNQALEERTLEDLIAQAAAKRQTPLELAKALQAYVNPSAACPDTWNDVYSIPFPYRVDYNAKRLALTSLSHAWYAGMLEAGRDNPYGDFLHWELSGAHIVYDVCDGYASHEEGLGEGNFPLSAAPLPHPFCTCLYYVDSAMTLAEIARDIARWEQGEPSARLDGMMRESFTVSSLPATISLDDVQIARSLGAMAQNYDIRDNDGNIYHYVEGTRVQNVQVFAGYGVRKPLHEEVAEGLAKEFSTSAEGWQHLKGIGTIDVNGEEVKVEVHWFKHERVGEVKHKIKEWLWDR